MSNPSQPILKTLTAGLSRDRFAGGYFVFVAGYFVFVAGPRKYIPRRCRRVKSSWNLNMWYL